MCIKIISNNQVNSDYHGMNDQAVLLWQNYWYLDPQTGEKKFINISLI